MNKELVVVDKPKSSASEAIRTLRTNLQFTFVDENIKSFMITSSMPGEGKSFISANLAAAFGLIDFKVLIADCDLRRGRLHNIFNVENKKGLSNLLLDDIKNYKKYITKTNVENVSLITGGIIPPNPSELLGSDKNKELFKILKENYDLVILDCPPVNGLTDSLVLTTLVDEVVLVSSVGKTPSELLNESKKSLEATGAKIAGVVVNNVEAKKNNYYYGKYYE